MRARAAGGDLELEAPGTAVGELRFPAIWLRDNCPCPECRDPRTGQKLFGIGDLPDGLTVATVEEGGIRAGGTEEATDSITVTYSPGGHRSRFTRSWLAGQALDGTAPGNHRTEDAKRLWAGSRPAGCAESADPPGTAVGWERFGINDPGTALRACQPLIDLDPHGRIRGVRFNNRSSGTLRRPYAEVVAFYAAYRRWAGLLARPERALTIRLRPGDCLIFDNTRTLHGRTAFTSAGGRHLQGCYADLDALASSLAVLERQEVAA